MTETEPSWPKRKSEGFGKVVKGPRQDEDVGRSYEITIEIGLEFGPIFTNSMLSVQYSNSSMCFFNILHIMVLLGVLFLKLSPG